MTRDRIEHGRPVDRVDVFGHSDKGRPVLYYVDVASESKGGGGHLDDLTRAELHELYAQAATLLGLQASPDPRAAE